MLKKIIKKNIGYWRYFYSRIYISLLSDGRYLLPYDIYHVSLRVDKSSTYTEDVKNLGTETADRWSRDGCGIASIKSAIISLKKKYQNDFILPSVAMMSELGISSGGYLKGVGWIHKYLSNIAVEHNLKSNCRAYESYITICMEILKKRIPIASVTYRFRGGDRVPDSDGNYKILGKGGHLIIVKGFEVQRHKIVKFMIDDPQNILLEDNKCSDEWVDIYKFEKSFSNKVIYVWD
jgi:hypothetical protein